MKIKKMVVSLTTDTGDDQTLIVSMGGDCPEGERLLADLQDEAKLAVTRLFHVLTEADRP